MIVLPIFLSTPDLVNGTPVFLAIVLFTTSTPVALLGENDVPGMPNIFMIVYNIFTNQDTTIFPPSFRLDSISVLSVKISLCSNSQ